MLSPDGPYRRLHTDMSNHHWSKPASSSQRSLTLSNDARRNDEDLEDAEKEAENDSQLT